MLKDFLIKYFKGKIKEVIEESKNKSKDSFNNIIFSYAQEFLGKENVKMKDGRIFIELPTINIGVNIEKKDKEWKFLNLKNIMTL